MSVRTVLKSRWSGRLLVGLIALSVAIFTALLLAGRAEAQEEAAAANTKTKTVEPGDSLWAIAQERLAPDASPQRVAEEVERTYALNRERLGEDPNLIRVGQELTLSPATSEPEPVEPEPVEPEPVETATYEPASGSEHVVNRERVAAEPPSEASAEASAEAGAEPVVLPELPEADAKLVASFVEAPSVVPERAVAETRRKAGYAVLLCTAAVALLGAARLLIAERQ